MNTALIGYGYWGPNIARNLKASPKTTLCAICDASPAMLAKARALYGDEVRYTTDYHTILDDPSIEAVAVALRHDVAFPIAQEVMRTGKHLFIEKPMATAEADVRLLGEISERMGVVLHTDHILVFNPCIRYVKRMIDSGELGELLYFDSSRVNLGPHIKNDINAMWDLAVHDLAVLDYLCDGQPVAQVSAVGMSHYSQCEELTYLTLRYESGLVGFLKSSWISPLKERMMVIGGTKKMVVFDDLRTDEKLMIYDKGVELPDDFTEYGRYEAKVRMGDLLLPYIPAEDSLRNSIEHFADCVAEGRQSVTGYQQAARVIGVLERADAQLRAVRAAGEEAKA